MALGRRKRKPVQGELFLTSADLPRSAGHPFYDKLNLLLEEAKYDEFVEDLCQSAYADGIGRPGIPPGVYFRMLFVGYFEDLDSQRGIAWKCSDSLSLRAFLGTALNERTPDHSSMSKIRERLSASLHESVFAWVLALCAAKKLLVDPKTVGVDSTTLEANAALKSIVRKASGDDYKTYLRKLMEAEGIENPSDEDLQKFDKNRKDKTLSNEDWESKTDPDARIMKMKDKTTHLGYKAENVVDLDSDVILSAEVYFGNEADSQTYVDSVMAARTHLDRIGLEEAEANEKLRIEEAVLDKGYDGAATLELAADYGIRTYIALPDRKYRSKWTDKPASQKKAVYANRRRMRGERGKALQKKRSEYVERTFAHLCETGGARRTWLRKLKNVRKRFPMAAAARNLGTLMRFLFGIGTPKRLQDSLSKEEKAAFEGGNALVWLWGFLLAIQTGFRARTLHHDRVVRGELRMAWIG